MKNELSMEALIKENKRLAEKISRLEAGLEEVTHKYNLLERLKDSSEDRAKKRVQELIEIQQELVAHGKLVAMGKLSGIVGHEIRGPIGTIKNSIEFLNIRLGKNMDEKVKRHLDILREEVNRSDKIISDILNFGRVKEPSLTMEDVNKIVDDSIKRLVVPANIEIATEHGMDLPLIKADVSQIQRVFSNIMLNAIQAMPSGGNLVISTRVASREKRVEREHVEIEFKDTGDGISEENLEKIFEPLFSTRGKGTGLGLAVCQNIIHAHQGMIEVESEVGRGTVFRVKLPI